MGEERSLLESGLDLDHDLGVVIKRGVKAGRFTSISQVDLLEASANHFRMYPIPCNQSAVIDFCQIMNLG